MKTQIAFRFSILLVLLVAASLTACKKGTNSDPAPDLATRVSGTYTFSELATGGKTYPATDINLKGTVTVTRQTATTVAVKLDIRAKSNNQTFLDDSAENVDVVETSGGNVEFRYQGQVVLRASGNKISFDSTDDSGEEFTLSAIK